MKEKAEESHRCGKRRKDILSTVGEKEDKSRDSGRNAVYSQRATSSSNPGSKDCLNTSTISKRIF